MPSKQVLQELEQLEGLWVAMTDKDVLVKGEDAAQVLREAQRNTRHAVTLFKAPRRDEEAHVL